VIVRFFDLDITPSGISLTRLAQFCPDQSTGDGANNYHNLFMTKIIFVHGTGVRRSSYEESLSRVTYHLKRDTTDVVSCLWGEECGVKLNKGGISIPDFDTTRAVEQMSEEDRDASAWAALYEDPLCELRLLALNKQQTSGYVPRQLTAQQQFEIILQHFRFEGELAAQIERCGLTTVWGEAMRRVTVSAEFRQALQKSLTVTTEIRRSVARACVADALSLRQSQFDDLADSITGNERDRLVNLLVEAFGGVDRGIVGDAFKQVIAQALTRYVRPRRGRLSELSFAAAGDILFYQARGQVIRDFIRERIEAFDSDVVLLAHSLGGIACVDLLAQHPLPQVKLLITAGSQAPLLYEINALVSLSFGEQLPQWFPRRWLNIYDPRDFLSYLARGVFHSSGIEINDLRVNNRQPFPQSHSAYWRNDQVWNAIREELND
jgi:hypothetical protein